MDDHPDAQGERSEVASGPVPQDRDQLGVLETSPLHLLPQQLVGDVPGRFVETLQAGPEHTDDDLVEVFRDGAGAFDLTGPGRGCVVGDPFDEFLLQVRFPAQPGKHRLDRVAGTHAPDHVDHLAAGKSRHDPAGHVPQAWLQLRERLGAEEPVNHGAKGGVFLAVETVRNLQETRDPTREGLRIGHDCDHLRVTHHPQISRFTPNRTPSSRL